MCAFKFVCLLFVLRNFLLPGEAFEVCTTEMSLGLHVSQRDRHAALLHNLFLRAELLLVYSARCDTLKPTLPCDFPFLKLPI